MQLPFSFGKLEYFVIGDPTVANVITRQLQDQNRARLKQNIPGLQNLQDLSKGSKGLRQDIIYMHVKRKNTNTNKLINRQINKTQQQHCKNDLKNSREKHKAKITEQCVFFGVVGTCCRSRLFMEYLFYFIFSNIQNVKTVMQSPFTSNLVELHFSCNTLKFNL